MPVLAQGDLKWTPTSTVKFPLLCVTAGLFAGIFGVGGGIIKGPLMLVSQSAPRLDRR